MRCLPRCHHSHHFTQNRREVHQKVTHRSDAPACAATVARLTAARAAHVPDGIQTECATSEQWIKLHNFAATNKEDLIGPVSA